MQKNKITVLSINGLFDKYDINWQLNDHISVLVGKNGVGKSSILSIINLFFNKNLKQDAKNRLHSIFNNAKLQFNNDVSIHMYPNSELSSEKMRIKIKEILSNNDEIGDEKANILFNAISALQGSKNQKSFWLEGNDLDIIDKFNIAFISTPLMNEC